MISNIHIRDYSFLFKLVRYVLITILILISEKSFISVLGQDITHSLSMTNSLNTPICEIYIRPVSNPYWGINRLPANKRLENNETYTWSLEAGYYRIRFISCDGRDFSDTTVIDLTEQDYTTTFSWSSSVSSCDDVCNLRVQADSLLSTGDSIGAVQSLQDALRLAELTNNQLDEIEVFISFGSIYERTGNYALALNNYEKAFALLSTSSEYVSVRVQTLAGLTFVYTQIGRYSEALKVGIERLNIAESLGDRNLISDCLFQLGSIYFSMREYALARSYWEKALTIDHETQFTYNTVVTLNAIGSSYWEEGNQEMARKYYLDALPIAEEFNDPELLGTIYHTLGLLYRRDGNYSVAIGYFDRAIPYWRSASDRVGEIFSYNDRGLAYELNSNFVEAITDYRASVEIIEKILNDAVLDQAVTHLITETQNFWPYERLAVLLTQRGDPITAFEYVERGRAILTRSELIKGQIDYRANVDQNLLNSEREFAKLRRDAQANLDQLRKSGATDQDIKAAEYAVSEAQTNYQQLLERMQLEGGYLARELAFSISTIPDIQAALPPNTTLIEYSIGYSQVTDPDSVVFIITNTTFDAIILDVDAHEIDKEVHAFISSRVANVEALTNLYFSVIAPIADKLRTFRIIIVPNRSLNFIPFTALNDGSNYLVDKYSISLAPSATVLSLLHNRSVSPQPSKAALVLAQPSAPNLPLLRFATAEATEVARIFGTQPVLNASETDIRSKVTGTAALYIAAHTELDPLDPFASVIHLAPSGTDDGVLEIREIYELDLSKGTDLVVLSGCDTGSANMYESFGQLNRAFMAAGAKRIIASLWSVDDEATATLLTTFVQQLNNQTDYADALRMAMIKTRKQFPEPYYWASFQLTGLP